MKYLITAALLLVACSSGGGDFEGRYQGEGVQLTLKKQSGPLYNGTLLFSGKRYPILLKAKGNLLKGKFEGEGGKDFIVTAKVEGAMLTLTSGGKAYRLNREGSGGDNPLAKGGKPATDDNPLAKGGKPATDDKPATKAAPKGFAGVFGGSFAGNAASLSTEQQGTTLTGKLMVGTYLYKLTATVAGESASGKLVDPKMGGALPCSASLKGDVITVRFAKGAIELRRGAKPTATAGGGVGQTPQTPAAGAGSAQRDRRLVGLWTRTEGMSSGGASYAAKQYLEIGANGSFRTGTGRSVAGGAGWSMGGGSGVTITGRGQWKTTGRIVYVNSGGGWSPYARYYTTGAKLMFTFANGNRQIWYRSR